MIITCIISRSVIGQYGAATDMKLRDVFSEMASKYGFRHGVMRGFWVTVLREMPAYAGFYSAYEFSKRTFGRRLHGPHASANQSLPVWATLTAGATGGIAYWTACYPLGQQYLRVETRGKQRLRLNMYRCRQE